MCLEFRSRRQFAAKKAWSQFALLCLHVYARLLLRSAQTRVADTAAAAPATNVRVIPLGISRQTAHSVSMFLHYSMPNNSSVITENCPKAVAWVSKASAANTAHASVECANQGVCDRSRGACECYAGFTGRACQRSKALS